ncbi:MAG TPA: type II toxin-antitoxin system prevent-host-death family antitoxin [Rhizomicrobium sp.]|nr:type II toxin-antitoxin system prevent-host-death family antitoxin [Rhizomicrobium sp.]
MSSVGAREANRSFSKILKEAESGKTVTITRNGKPVARLVPAGHSRTPGKAEEKALAEFLALLERGIPLGGGPYSREEMHKRR